MIQKEVASFSPDYGPNVWVLTDGKAGDRAQCLGVAVTLSDTIEERVVTPGAPFVWVMPFGPIDPREAETRAGSPIAPPYPDVVIASGRRTVPYLRRIGRLTGGKALTVFLKDPRTGAGTADLIWVPRHDKLRGPNVLVTDTAPHLHSPQALAEARTQAVPVIDALPAPRIATLVGGDSRHHRFTDASIKTFVAGLKAIAQAGKSGLMITSSRRTPAVLVEELEEFACQTDAVFWTPDTSPPLTVLLAKADAIVATADSTNMIGEAAATGKPIHVFHPEGGHPKIEGFLGNLRRLGMIHPFPGPMITTTYEPLDSTQQIAGAIRQALEDRKDRD